MEYTYYKKENNLTDRVLDIAEYSIDIAEVLGVNTKTAGIGLIGVQAARLCFTPYDVEKPKNEMAKFAVGVGSNLLGNITGNKRAALAAGLIAKVIIDLAIEE